ncbi:hypothetical protein BS78_05G074700 [Paspalum vaginatum]|nr:hypothetical protein BS78_05G074700 [Paspalum vaginatum]
MNNTVVAGQGGLFRGDSTTRSASVEAWVVLTTLLLLAKFAVGSIGARISSRKFVAAGVLLLKVLNHSCVTYTLGLMRPSSSSNQGDATFFQVWAVLIVIMQESVQIGRPYRPREMTLVKLLSSLWSANLLWEQKKASLMVPLWCMWSIHASRIVWYYVCCNRASEASVGNIKLVSDYMMTFTSQHTEFDYACPGTMRGYRYIVVGEEEQRMLVEPPQFALEMDPAAPKAAELITLQTVWDSSDHDDRLLSAASDSDNRLKDVCLSFALYKLQRRRFFNFPIAEATHPATRRLVSHVVTSHKRALRITEVELSFLRDSLYSKHAAVFSGGFPKVRLALSLLMAAAALYLVYAVSNISGVAVAVTHGVAVTHCIIGIIVYREFAEVGIYVLSQWTKVRIICHHIKLKEGKQGRFGAAQRLITEMVAKIMFRVIRRGKWDRQIRQYNLLMAAFFSCNKARNPVASLVLVLAPTELSRLFIFRKVKLQSDVQRVLFGRLKAILDTPIPLPDQPPAQQMDNQLRSYTSNAFGSSDMEGAVGDLEGETHKILVWHIATSLCQIELLEKEGALTRQQKANLHLLPEHQSGGGGLVGRAGAGYVTAVSLSNYCAYLVTQALVPDTGLVADKVFRAVFDDVRDASRGCRTMAEIWKKLTVSPDNGMTATTTIVSMGAQLSKRLSSECPRVEDLWERLGTLWAGFLLHLSASTRSAKHRIHLQGRGELTTHLWVLLSHAGFLGPLHGQQILDPLDLNQA